MKTKYLKIKSTTGIIIALCVLCQQLYADKNVSGSNSNHPKLANNSSLIAGCAATTSQNDLDINNVRATILVGGDMWWDLNSARYEVPKGSSKHSLFSGALWIGGKDISGNVLVAAQTYRQTGNDFWGGPFDTTNVTITNQKCLAYDKHFIVTKQEVEEFSDDPSKVTNVIKNWPGNGNFSNPTEGRYLAPFFDNNGDGLYNYTNGDFPGYNLSGEFPNAPNGVPKAICNDYLFGDKTLWWVFNDVGNAHTETNSASIGLEIRAQAFGFKSNDEINDMTFYKYQIINRSSTALSETYFGQWVDPDLGNALDDLVGCDVNRGLGYCYNGDADDDGVDGYGINPPAVGVDFFQGPVADIDDNLDNDRDGCEDCTFIIDINGDTTVVSDTDLGEQIIMSKFVYYINQNDLPFGNPEGFNHFYNYLRGIWGDGLPITYGGTGRDPLAPQTDFMFPGNTDPKWPSLGDWFDPTVEDKRFIQSAGPFTLASGAVNYVTTGVVWSRATQGGPLASLELIKLADDKAQALFDNCFKLLDGPNAPDVVLRELDKEIILSLVNTENAKVELYNQIDPTIVGYPDSLRRFNFQGYQVYQLKNSEVTTAELKNPDRARLLAQCDIRDGIGQLVNFYFDPVLNALIPVEEVKGADAGIVHTFKITKDLFASGATNLVNHKTYFYTVISYAYNRFASFNPFNPDSLNGQQKPFKAGRNNIKTYTAIPHASEIEANGQILNSSYGDGPSITRIEGQGNGGMVLDFTDATINEIIANNISYHPVYQNSKGPANIKVYDPTLVKAGNFELKLDGVADTSGWALKEIISGSITPSDRNIASQNEQVLGDFGLSVTINKIIEAGKAAAINNAFLEATIEYSDNSQRWLNSLKDTDGDTPENWIRSGTNNITPSDWVGIDDEQVYENVVDGTWAPYRLTAKGGSFSAGPMLPVLSPGQFSLSPISSVVKTSIASVDIVITNDRSKWSRVAVIEMGNNIAATIGAAKQFDLRKSPSAGKEENTFDNTILAEGMGWFPGYAVNLETGERLNIAYGENSYLPQSNSTDMRWNPTTSRYRNDDATDSVYFGGMHYIFVFGHNGDNIISDVPAYDQCRFIATMLDSAAQTNNSNIRRNVWKDCMWTSIPILSQGKTLLGSEVKIRLRIAKTYRTHAGSKTLRSNEDLISGQTYYVSSIPVTYNSVTYNETGLFFAAVSGVTKFTGSGTVTASAPRNNFNPYYTFNSSDIAAFKNDIATAKNALDLINVIPNPYYSYSAYEGTSGVNGQLDNRIKIVNLPAVCTISIFNLNGTLIRQFKRDVFADNSEGGNISDLKNPNRETSQDWDLKNHKGVAISSGLYIININAIGLGERTIKWFGVLRPIDLDTF